MWRRVVLTKSSVGKTLEPNWCPSCVSLNSPCHFVRKPPPLHFSLIVNILLHQIFDRIVSSFHPMFLFVVGVLNLWHIFFPLQRHLVCVCVTTMDPTPDTLSRVDSSHAVLFLSSSIVCKKRERGGKKIRQWIEYMFSKPLGIMLMLHPIKQLRNYEKCCLLHYPASTM